MDKHTRMNPFASWLWERLEETDKNQTDVARGIGIAQSAISSWLNGKSLPTRRSIKKIAHYFGVEPDIVLSLTMRSEMHVDEKRDETPEGPPGLVILGRPSYIRPETEKEIMDLIERDYRRHLSEKHNH